MYDVPSSQVSDSDDEPPALVGEDGNLVSTEGDTNEIMGVAQAWSSQDMLDEYLWQLHDNLDPSTELELVNGIRRFAALHDGQVLNLMALYAGCNVKQHVDVALTRLWRLRYGIEIKLAHPMMAEHDMSKVEFLKSQFDNFIMVIKAEEMASADVIDHFSGEQTGVPPVHALASGFPCTSRTSLSSRSAGNVNCAQQGKDATGIGAATTLSTIDTHEPQEVMMENVPNLAQKLPSSDMSDAEWLTQQLQARKYWAVCVDMDSKERGLCIPRHRLWWLGLRNLVGAEADISHFFLTLLSSLKVPENRFSLDHFFTRDNEVRAEESRAAGFKPLAECGPRIRIVFFVTYLVTDRILLYTWNVTHMIIQVQRYVILSSIELHVKIFVGVV